MKKRNDDEHRKTMEVLLKTYLELDDQCVDHVGDRGYSELMTQRGNAAKAIVTNHRLVLHLGRAE
jgi:hypothetical protein